MFIADLFSKMDTSCNALKPFISVYLLVCLQEQRRKKEQVRRYMRDISKDAIYAEDRELALQELWPRILTDMVRAAVIDMIRMDVYMKGCLEKLCNS